MSTIYIKEEADNYAKSADLKKASKNASQILTSKGGNRLLVGDIIILPNTINPQIYEDTIGDNAAFYFLALINGKYSKLYPSTFGRRIWEYSTEDNKPILDNDGNQVIRQSLEKISKDFLSSNNLSEWLETYHRAQIKVKSAAQVWTKFGSQEPKFVNFVEFTTMKMGAALPKTEQDQIKKRHSEH